MNSHQILVLEGNTSGGNDYIIGDIHGNAPCFSEMLRQLTPADRLFLVGDLTDRGVDSPAVIRSVIDYQKNYPERLFVVLGNHELSCLRTISILEKIFGYLSSIPYDDQGNQKLSMWCQQMINTEHKHVDLNALKRHLKDGATWLVFLFREEISKGLIKLSDNHQNGIGGIHYHPDSLIYLMVNFINSLPTVIYVNGEHPFLVVHADMPISDAVLAERISHQKGLIEKEIEYATKAREADKDVKTMRKWTISDEHRNPFSTIAYCGHSIITYNKAVAVRYPSNSVNLDVATFLTNVSLRVNHTLGVCEYIGVNVAESLQKYINLSIHQSTLNQHLKAEMERYYHPGSIILPKHAMVQPAYVEEEPSEKPLPLSPSKRTNANLKRERDEVVEKSPGKGTPPRVGGVGLFADGRRMKKPSMDLMALDDEFQNIEIMNATIKFHHE